MGIRVTSQPWDTYLIVNNMCVSLKQLTICLTSLLTNIKTSLEKAFKLRNVILPSWQDLDDRQIPHRASVVLPKQKYVRHLTNKGYLSRLRSRNACPKFFFEF